MSEVKKESTKSGVRDAVEIGLVVGLVVSAWAIGVSVGRKLVGA